MKLTDEEKTILDGRVGLARQKAMELLVRYGEALGAERLVQTNNVCISITGLAISRINSDISTTNINSLIAQFYLDSEVPVEMPRIKTHTCRLIREMDPEYWQVQGISPKAHEINLLTENMCGHAGMQLMHTCAPYLVGNVPVMGEHCAWIESSAVIYCNSVLGGRTNTEGMESAAAAALVGRTPYWGYHIDENRRGTHLVEVERQPESVMDWGLLGYYIGEIVQENVPVINNIRNVPNIARLKHHGAAAASSGGVELYHIMNITPEAHNIKRVFGGKKPVETLKYGPEERKQAYRNLTSATDDTVDFVMLGCPHYTLEEVTNAAMLLENKRVRDNVSLWIFTPKALKIVADQEGITDIITKAGAYLMTDTCPCIGRFSPKGARIAATDSAKHAHYMPAILNIPTWFGSQSDCIEAAVTGKWQGELK
ncbi:MAG TPA: aconitase X catalytic domain-containing protein [Dehalococcoidales bacterium]|nr:aconitase X catalytic domain-containing protein [Dehalococcoidales bacterium]